MEENFDKETVAADDSMKSRILERIKAQMAQESSESGYAGGGVSPIYLKAPDDWP